MISRRHPYAIAVLAALALATPAEAQTCNLEPPVGARSAEVVYVPNRSDSTISVVDVTPGSRCRYRVVQTIGIDRNSAPTSVFIHPDGRRAYVVQSSRNNVGVIDTRTGEEIDRIPIDPFNGSLAGAMSPDGSRLYVSNLLLGSISVVDTVNGVQLPSIPLAADSFPVGLRVTPDGTRLWATMEFPGSIAVIDVEGDANSIEQVILLEPIPGPEFTPGVPPAAIDVAFDTSGSTTIANVLTLGRKNVVTASGHVVSVPDALYRIPIGYDAAANPPVQPVIVGTYDEPFGPGAAEIVVTPAGSAWITNSGLLDPLLNVPVPDADGHYTDYVTVLGPGSAAPVAVRSGFDDNPSGPADNLSPVGLARSQPGGGADDQVYAVNFTSGTLAIFDAATEALEAVVPVGNGPVTPFQRRIPALPTAPSFALDGGGCGRTLEVQLGNTLEFTLAASTVAAFDDEDDLTLTVDGLPAGATMQPALPLTGDDTVSSRFSWPAPPADGLGTHVVTFTASGAFTETSCRVTVAVVEPSPEVNFQGFIVLKLHVDGRPRKGNFDIRGAFRLADDSDGIYPTDEDVILGLDDFALVVPAGAFRERGRSFFAVDVVVDGVRVHGWLKGWPGWRGDKRWWTFHFKGKGAELGEIDNPVEAALQIGDDVGATTKIARIKH